MIAEVLLDRKIGNSDGRLSYLIPDSLKGQIKAGDLVEAPLRKQKVRGLVIKITEEMPKMAVKPILRLIAPQMLLPWQLKLLKWLSEPALGGKSHRLIKKFIPDYILEGKLEPSVTRHPVNQTTERKKTTKPNFFISNQQSKKWELLLKKIKTITDQNLQVLILTPEIEPAPVWMETLNKIAPAEIFSGKNTIKQHALLWEKIAKNEIKIVVGSRLAPYAPLRNLGLIIMTNEHDETYEQDNQPAIHTREIALKIQEFSGCEMILESPFPKLETFEKAKEKQWSIFAPKRSINLSIIDLRDEMKKRNYSPLSEELQEKLIETIEKNQQAILFLNRRGTGSAVLCRDCGHIERCENCETPYTFHKSNILICHSCGKEKSSPVSCPVCGNVRIKLLGTGTEKVEIEIRRLFPGVSMIRIDKDTMKNAKELDEASRTFRAGHAKILLATSMMRIDLTPEVDLVGALLPDTTLTYPSFESNKNTLQQLHMLRTLLAKNGNFIVQTYLPEHHVFETFQTQENEKFYEEERKTRKMMEFMNR